MGIDVWIFFHFRLMVLLINRKYIMNEGVTKGVNNVTTYLNEREQE